ncbi:hypothetical protein ACFU9B_32845 [Streptomyces sp. NPDC057592]|uniref:hypothetical protein n=1 Tax=unclassified Streptomyces TaxID=2593676 RepID=UPI0036A99827
MPTRTPVTARRKAKKAHCGIVHRRFLTPAQQESLSTRYPHGPRARSRFLLDHYEDRPDALTSLLGMRHWAARRIARGWAIPLSYARRDQLRLRGLRLVCALCQK